jgi:hypothetical protein
MRPKALRSIRTGKAILRRPSSAIVEGSNEKAAARQSFEIAPLKNCALHKFTPQRLQGAQFFNLVASEIHDFSIT